MEKTNGGGMSPRIQELALESGAWHQVYGNRMFTIDEHFDIEKFARLIVKECLGISYKESHLPNAILFDERSDKFIKDIHNRIDRATKKHFGVES
jgi:hypothetical protein